MHHNYLLTRAHTKSLATRTAKDTIIRRGNRAYTYSNSSYRRYLRDRRRPVAWLAADSVRTSTDSHRWLRNPLWIMDLLFDLRRPVDPVDRGSSCTIVRGFVIRLRWLRSG